MNINKKHYKVFNVTLPMIKLWTQTVRAMTITPFSPSNNHTEITALLQHPDVLLDFPLSSVCSVSFTYAIYIYIVYVQSIMYNVQFGWTAVIGNSFSDRFPCLTPHTFFGSHDNNHSPWKCSSGSTKPFFKDDCFSLSEFIFSLILVRISLSSSFCFCTSLIKILLIS